MAEQLTLERIQNSPNLRRLGALPGDEIENKKLVRKFSSKENQIDLGEKLTEERISNSENLQKLEAKPGDRIVDKKLIRTNTDSAYQQFMYGMDESQGLVALGSDVLTAMFPESWMSGRLTLDFENGLQYHSPEEFYGKEFVNASEDERRNLILRQRERGLVEEYGQYFEPDDGGIARGAGQVTGMIADPTTLIAPGSTLPRVMGVSASLGGTYSVLEDMASTGEIDPEKAITYGAFSAIGGAAGYGIARGVGALSKKRKTKKELSDAQNLVKNANSTIAKDIQDGYLPTEAVNRLDEIHGFDNLALKNATALVGKPLKVPPTTSQAAKIAKDTVSNDITAPGYKTNLVEDLFGVMSTKLRNIDEAVLGRLRKYYFDVNVNTSKTLQKVDPFIQNLRLLKQQPDLKLAITRNLYNGNFKKAETLMSQVSDDMVENFNSVKNVLKNVYDESQKAGIHFDELSDYFPRQVKDLKKFRKTLGNEGNTTLTKLENDYAKRLGLNSANDLSLGERSYVANQYVRGYSLTNDRVPRFAKQRKIEDLSDDFIKEFYEDPADSLALYLRNAVNSIEKYKFFGRNAVKKDNGIFNTEDSIGRLIQEEKMNGRLNPLDEDEVVDILQDLFVSADKPMRKSFGSLRDLGYMGTIGNPYAAITQLGDLANSGALHGLKNTITAVIRNILPEKTPLIGREQLKLIDIGYENIAQELSDGNVKLTSKLLNKIFDITGFRRFDRLGKESTINAAISKNFNRVKTKKGEESFRKEFGQLYEFKTGLLDDIVNDLKTGKFTDNVKFHAFNELSEIQPITMLEMPQPYVSSPNARLAYMLKSFTLKQWDIARRKIYQEIKKGNVVEGTKNLTLLGGYMMAANTGTRVIKDFLKGREIEPDRIDEYATQELMSVYGFNKYSTERLLRNNNLQEYLGSLVIPPMNLPSALFIAAPQELGKLSNEMLGTEFGDINFQMQEADFGKVFKDFPVVGPIYYNWFGGGAEKYNMRQITEGALE